MDCSDEELLDRYKTVFYDYTVAAPKLEEQLEAFGRLRNELQLLVAEIFKRKLKVEDPDALPAN